MSVIISMGLVFVVTDCSDDEKYADKGHQAAIEFCDCYKKNTWDECLKELKTNYADAYKHYAFDDAFDEKSDCDITYIELMGREAATEFCDCYEKNSKDKCLKDLNAHTSYKTNEFINILNEVNECDFKFELITASAEKNIVIQPR
jgi:hypothetical protein